MSDFIGGLFAGKILLFSLIYKNKATVFQE